MIINSASEWLTIAALAIFALIAAPFIWLVAVIASIACVIAAIATGDLTWISESFDNDSIKHD